MEATACIQDLLKNMNEFSQVILNILDSDSETEELFTKLTKYLDDHNIKQDKSEIKLILHTITKISNNHHRMSNFFDKIERIFKLFTAEIQNFFTNIEIFHIFKENKRLLLFLFEEKIITPDNIMCKIITSKEYENKKYPEYFFPEFERFYDQKTLNNIKSNNSKIDFKSPSFLEKRRIGENDSPASLLIRNDSVDEFREKFGNKPTSWFTKDITESIFETNPFLCQKNPSYIEYSAFFGSIKIFKYLLSAKKEFTNSILSFAIHGRNIEIIQLIEGKFKFKPSDMALVESFVESLRVFHNELTDHLYEKYYNNPQLRKKLSTNCFQYFNFISFIDEMINEVSQAFQLCNEKGNKESNNMFCHLCESDYIKFVELFLKEKNLNVNAVLIFTIFFLINEI
ncbi:hypothetical protein M9Y10_016705 [Tritrichomonas musculus]|uniref:DUF3447 domain-containing protein n=1 Tax=Tritrichomonas musculus TaxID=1915356 RepID=A0ABR2HWX8_9EUKA